VCKVRCDECPAPPLLPTARPGVAAYVKCSTQWRNTFGGRTGLDYPACIQILKLARRAWRREAPDDPLVKRPLSALMEDLQIIESAMLAADAERRDREERERRNK
jgi:hypothetical protein